MPKTLVDLLAEKLQAQCLVQSVDSQIRQLDCCLLEAHKKYEQLQHWDKLGPHTLAELLAAELVERDWPLTGTEIRAIFESSGHEYDTSHVLASRPNSRECCDEYIRQYGGEY